LTQTNDEEPPPEPPRDVRRLTGLRAPALAGLVLSVVGRFELGRWDVAVVRVEAVVVEPVDPLGGRVFDVVDGAPRTRCLISSVLYKPLIVSAKALS
jgi:hypothetical protein